MKKVARQAECGVWLDTVQLKGNAKKKLRERPISKLLNPLLEGKGYSLAVALNFTQTKMEMPKTKQSSISSFFASERRVLNKMSTSEAVQSASSSPSSKCSSTPPKSVASGAKRRRDTAHEMSDLYNTELQHGETDYRGEEVDLELKRNRCENEAPCWQEPKDEEQSEEEISPPERKRKFTETLLPADGHLLGQECTQDSSQLNIHSEIKWYDNFSQDYTTAKTIGDSEPSFLNSLQSEEVFGNWTKVEGRTSTQKPFRHLKLSHGDNEKENCRLSCYKSPSKHSPLSPLKTLSNHNWIEPKIPSPRKRITDKLSRIADEDERLQRTKRGVCPAGEDDEDSLTMLFTQDSEGFRVIAHRGPQARNPLKDQTNSSFGTMRTTSNYKPFVEEDEEEMLFTQDSQGNLVIKH
ncbi:uncharacterized protein aunip [Genypterus blacodes]|uniref:uncharacterized protein aunip n=1 Tax=Genypterus blacodes TaxID=154954 RepID=UPI003F75C0ED